MSEIAEYLQAVNNMRKIKLTDKIVYWLIDAFLASAFLRFTLESAMDLQFTAILQIKYTDSWIPTDGLEFIKLYGALSFIIFYAIFSAFIYVKIV
jgi:hypothetical protein